jgi:hypothetical protein
MKKALDICDYATLSEYVDAVRSAGYSFPAVMGWVIQSTMKSRECTFHEAMDLLIRAGTIVLVPNPQLPGKRQDTNTIDVKQRLEDLDACPEKDVDQTRAEKFKEGERQQQNGETEGVENIS